jgi:hypothetical protein
MCVYKLLFLPLKFMFEDFRLINDMNAILNPLKFTYPTSKKFHVFPDSNCPPD